MKQHRTPRQNNEYFRHLHETTYDSLFYYLYMKSGDRQLSEDIIQESFILLWERIDGFDSLAGVKSFLYQTVRNKLMNRLRDERIRRRILESRAAEPPTPPPNDDSDVIEAEVVSQLYAAISGLPTQTERVVSLTLSGMTVEQVADELGVSVNTVKTLKKAAYRALRTKLSHLKSAAPLLYLLFW
ncbi:MAG: sigma-70 family RNA polymerase sigma factor [Rikenellaceae bacterium]|nr:sigma-70 family RNA polymerase sigma factor [Rikenellaceae bacterium]MCL2692265.1 sigma-70 family RNA polymerase sigma factor [Rikenellaceae bacterium]